MSDKKELPSTPPKVETRKPYEAPQLKPLGSVKELTLALSGSGVDFGRRSAM